MSAILIYPKRVSLCMIAATLAVVGLSSTVWAITWSGGSGTDINWSTGGNWIGGSAPGASDPVLFDDTGAAAAAGTVTNIVDADFTISQLQYQQFVQNTKYHTTQIKSGYTLLSTGNLEVNYDLTIPPSTYTTTVNTAVTGPGAFQVGSTGTSTADVIIGFNAAGGDTDTGILDLSGLATFTTHLDELALGYGGGPAVGNLTLAASNTLNANTIVIGDNYGNGAVTAAAGSTVAINTGSLNLGTRYITTGTTSGKLDLSGAASATIDATTITLGEISGTASVATSGEINLGTSNLITVDTFLIGSNKSTGNVDIVAGGTLNLGTTSDRGDLFVGRKSMGTAVNCTGTMDLSAGAVFNAYVNTLAVGSLNPAATSTGDATGVLKLAPTNMIDADTIDVGYTNAPSGASSASVGTGTLSLSPGGTLTIGNSGQAAVDRADLRVGFKDVTTPSGANGTLDLTDGTFNAWLGEFVVGYNDAGDTSHNTQGTATLGSSNTIIADTVRIGDTKATGNVSITSGGTLNLGSTTERADLLVGHNTTGSSHPSTGTLDLTGGTFNAYLDTLAIGRSLLGSGPPTGVVTLDTSNNVDVNTIVMGPRSPDTGTLTVGGGTVTVNNNVTGGTGTSTLNLEGGTMTVAGNLTVDNLLVGKNAKTGSLAVGGAVAIGGSGSLILGLRDIGGSGTTSGTLDLSGATSVNIDVDTITLGDIPGGGSTALTRGILHLGASNTVAADTFYVAHRKGTATVDIVGGGTLNLGTDPDRVDLKIGYNDENTSTTSNGTMNLTGGTLVARLDEFVIGFKASGSASGSGIGVLTLGTSSGNDVRANSVLLGDYQASSTGSASGTINLSGGSFDIAGDLVRGAGGPGKSTSIVNVEGGTMTVGGNVAVDRLIVADNGPTGSFTAGSGATVEIDHLTIGDRGGHGTFTAGAGATLQVGPAGSPTDLFVGRKTASDGASGLLDLSAAASFTANLDSWEVGVQTAGTSTGGGTTGTVKLAASNNIDAALIRLGGIDSGSTSSSSGTLNLGNANTITTDTLIVGHDKSTGNLNFLAGGTLNLGTSSDRADLEVGFVESETSTTATGTADLSGGTVVAFLDELLIGHYLGSIGRGSAIGTLTLSADPGNNVQVNSVVLGNRPGAASNYSGTRTASGTINLDGGTFAVAGDLVRGANGGLANNATTVSTVNVDGAALTVGGTMDVDTLTLNSGLVDANNILLGGTAARLPSGTSTVDLNDGTLRANSITQGVGAADFNFTGGTLTVDTFGLDELEQDGGILAPGGNSVGTTTIQGNYEQDSGSLAIQLDGPGSYDRLIVEGDVELSGDLDLTLNFDPSGANSSFLILDNQGSDFISGEFANYAEGDEFFLPYGSDIFKFTITYLGGTGNDVMLGNVPEPASLVLAALAALCLAGYRWRKRDCS